ncbi:MAG: LysR family transcriptional regulator [Rhodococcus sp. (in: high G+C Gram-positive bacteria)]|uniref:LysR family transcriptional regulator n=1 Tax=Rhodococcus sp. TaxID=1831 RepID=UPI00120D0251|nr:LysR family transcriptional regulator [Rhodococcus sp. (in: high G+C Gram-positive bacteria)]RZL22093.1 MAG: LysR family transcriptional regulator [Rhodococcus sp. (in: high G+C Gram-positive bacteria)]
MEFRQMEYFLAVVENKGISGAAAALGVAQPTVSQALRGLERELGVRLFHRIGRGMVLSAAGRSLVGPSRQVLRDVTAAEGQLTAADGAVVGRLDIMAFPALTSGTIVDLIAEFCIRYPRARVRFSELEREDNLDSLIRDGHCEFAVAHLPLEAAKGFEIIELGEQDYRLVYPVGTELPKGPVRLAEMPDIPMVFVPRGAAMGDAIEDSIRKAGTRTELAVVTEQRESRLPMVIAGLGGSLVERAVAKSMPGQVVERACEPRFLRTYGLVFDPSILSPVGQAFVDLVHECLPG